MQISLLMTKIQKKLIAYKNFFEKLSLIRFHKDCCGSLAAGGGVDAIVKPACSKA